MSHLIPIDLDMDKAIRTKEATLSAQPERLSLSDWPMARLGDVIRQVSDPHIVHVDQSYPNLGLYSFGRGLFPKSPIDGATTSARTLFRVREGQFIYSRLFAF